MLQPQQQGGVRSRAKAGEDTLGSGSTSPLRTSSTIAEARPLVPPSPSAALAAQGPGDLLPSAGGRAWRQSPGGRHVLVLSLAVLGCLYLLVSWGNALDFRHTEFVHVEGTEFSLGCRPFLVSGFNVDNIGQAAMAKVARKLAPSSPSGRQMVRRLMQQAAAANLNVMRTFAHTTDPNFPLQVRPGEYDEDAFRALDYVIAEAERAGLRMMLSFVDNWKYFGGVDEFVDWSATVPPRDARYPPNNKYGDVDLSAMSSERQNYENRRKVHFYNDTACRTLYKNHVRTVLERHNSVTGRQYRDDPTILGFNLINEPRCSVYETPNCASIFNKWVHDMATHFKSLDQHHLLTIGSEGFWSEKDSFRESNPGMPSSDWAHKAGQEFIENHDIPLIDFCSIHTWPDNWNIHNLSFHRSWIEKHVDDGNTLLKRPVLVGEYGKVLGRGGHPPPEAIAKQRDPVFDNVLSAVERAVGRKQAMAGSLYWRWGFSPYSGEPGPYGVLPEHSTFKLVTEHAQRMKAFMNTQPPRQECQRECWAPATSLFGLLRRCELRPSVCTQHWVRKQYQKSHHGDDGRLVAHGPEVFTSQAECCRPGLGGHRRGCTSTLF